MQPQELTAYGDGDSVMDEANARRITERIRYTAMAARDSIEKLQRLVSEAQQGQAHIALGYRSWTEYLSEVMGENPMRLERDQRRDVVAWLAGEGMSTRAIAPIVGANFNTVARDLRGVSNDTPAPSPTIATGEGVVIAEQRHVELPPFDPATGEVIEVSTPAPKVVGIDGKEYSRPQPANYTPRADALPKQYLAAIVELDKALEKIEKLHSGDRFAANKKNVALIHKSDIQRAIHRLEQLETQL